MKRKQRRDPPPAQQHGEKSIHSYSVKGGVRGYRGNDAVKEPLKEQHSVLLLEKAEHKRHTVQL